MLRKVLIRGPILTASGYGVHARTLYRALKSKEHLFKLYIIPTTWGQTGWITEDTQERKDLDRIIAETQIAIKNQEQFDISLQVTVPNEWQKLAITNIGVTAGIETTKVAPVWIQKGNQMDKIVTISEHSKFVFENSVYAGHNPQTGQEVELQLKTPVEVIGYPVKDHEAVDLGIDLEYDMNYLTVCQMGPRKNLGNLIQWFCEENFDQEVGLVIKTSLRSHNIIDREHTESTLNAIINNFPDRKCKIYLLHGDLTEQEMHSLYQHPQIKCYITTTHGEGFGLPIFEAAYNAMPVIASGWSGHRDFLHMPDPKNKKKGKPMFATVEYDIQPIQKEAVWEGVLQEDSMWCYPREGSFKRRLRETRTGLPNWQKKAQKLQKWIKKEFSEEVITQKYIDVVAQDGEEYDVEAWLSTMDKEIQEIE